MHPRVLVWHHRPFFGSYRWLRGVVLSPDDLRQATYATFSQRRSRPHWNWTATVPGMPRTDDIYRCDIEARRSGCAHLRMRLMQLHREDYSTNRINLDERSPLVSNFRRDNCFWSLGHYLLHQSGVAYRLHADGHIACCNRLSQLLRVNSWSKARASSWTELNPNLSLGNWFTFGNLMMYRAASRSGTSGIRLARWSDRRSVDSTTRDLAFLHLSVRAGISCTFFTASALLIECVAWSAAFSLPMAWPDLAVRERP